MGFSNLLKLMSDKTDSHPVWFQNLCSQVYAADAIRESRDHITSPPPHLLIQGLFSIQPGVFRIQRLEVPC